MKDNHSSKRRGILILVSLLIATATWFFVDTANGTEATITISDILVEYVGEETALAERGLLLLDDSPQYVTLKLRGVRSVISKLDPDQVRIQADLSGITDIGEQSVTWHEIYPSSEFADSISVVDADPYTVTVNVGDLFSKEVPVQYEIKGTVAEGYSAGALELDPVSFEIRGLQETVEQVSYAKVVFEIDDATRSVTQSLAYEFYDSNDKVVDGSDLQTEVSIIDVTMPVNLTKQLRLVVDFEQAPGASLDNVSYTLSPEYITVTGDAELVDRLNVVFLDTFNLLDLTGTATHHYTITLPEGIENLSGYSRATMQIAFDDMQNSTVLTEQFVLNNVPEGKTVSVVSTSVGVRIFGTSTDVDAVLPENIVLTADLSNYGFASGTYTVPVTVTLNTAGDIGLLGTYQIQVDIEDEPEEVPEPEPDVEETPDDGTQQENENDTNSDH